MTTKNETLDIKTLGELEEYFAAGLCEQPDAEPMTRFSRAFRRWFENLELGSYSNELLFPTGSKFNPAKYAMVANYSYGLEWANYAYETKIQDSSPLEKQALQQIKKLFEDEREKSLNHLFKTRHLIGGAGYTHAIINYGRVIREGFESYGERIEAKLAQCNKDQKVFYNGLLDVLKGIKLYHQRIIEHLKSCEAKYPNSSKLVEALKQVPLKPARNFYEAMVCYNFIYYIDGCDNPGRIDQELCPYFQADNSIGHDFALELMSAFVDNVCANGGWSCAIGGSHADGNPAYNEMTEMCIEASHNKFRPSLELRVRDDMPEKIWELSANALATGCGQPAFYNEAAYIKSIREAGLGVSDEDVVKWNGGGCTETMIHGCSNVGSLDAGLNLLLILEQTLSKTLCDNNVTFDQIVETYKNDIDGVIKEVTEILNEFFTLRAKHHPQPIRSLFMDDCIDKGRDFNDGGARYNWSIVNIAGVANVADSLQAIREVIYERQHLTPLGLLKILQENFEENESVRQQLLGCDKFGNDLDSVDSLAAEISEFTYKTLTAQKCLRGKFIPSHIMFETYAYAGGQVGATPDGRFAKTPLSDSCGPMQGNDTHGPTAMLKSVTKLPLHMAWGTPVLNMKFSKKMFNTDSSRRTLEDLVKTYFKLGGMQVQISVLDRQELLDAMDNPKSHEDLIVRIGGYSTYFNQLSRDLKEEVIKRTEYIT